MVLFKKKEEEEENVFSTRGEKSIESSWVKPYSNKNYSFRNLLCIIVSIFYRHAVPSKATIYKIVEQKNNCDFFEVIFRFVLCLKRDIKH